jgi:hypothetical protein
MTSKQIVDRKKERDSYALKLFSLINCSKCIETKNLMALMSLLPWSLQEEVLRSDRLSRQERLEKVVFACKLIFHYYQLSLFLHAPGVPQRFHSKITVSITFAEDSDWPRILNTAIALIHFILDADENWSFSLLETHCLEIFSGS